MPTAWTACCRRNPPTGIGRCRSPSPGQFRLLRDSKLASQTSGMLKYTILAATAYFFEVTIGNVGLRVHGGVVTWDQP